MRIDKVEVFDTNPEGCSIPYHPVMVRIHTDEGLTGVGEAALAYGCGHSGAAGMLVNLAQSILLGRDPLLTEKIWSDMMATTFWGHSPGPVFYGALSAIDIALWDIKGKFYNVPVYKLLGDASRTSIRAYASQVQFGWSDGAEVTLYRPEDIREVTRTMMDDGFTCVKINPFRYDENGNFLPTMPEKVRGSLARAIVQRVAAVREEGGENLDIIIECNSRCSAAVAIQIGQMLNDLNCMYLEEPVHQMEPSVFRDVASKVKIPLAAGERLYTRWQFLPYLKERLIGLAQPDVGLAGGITEAKKICDLAQIFDVGVQAHICGGPVGVAASLQIAATVANYSFQEHHVRCKQKGVRALVYEDYQPKNGYFDLPQKPGLGVELNEELVNKSPKQTIK